MDHSFDISIAQKYGIPAAILYRHFQFWIAKNKADGRHLHDGRSWSYHTRHGLTALFPYLGEKQVRGAIKRLIDGGEIIKGNYNKRGWDRTTWYAFADEKTAFAAFPAHWPKGPMERPKGPMEQAKRANGTGQKGQTIPDNKPDTKPDNAKADLSGLSGKATAEASLGMRKLRRRGVIEDVAKSLAAVHTDADIDQAIKNGLALKLQQQGPFNLAGYVVETLNTAREEGGSIKPTKLARQLKRKFAEKMRPTAKLTAQQVAERKAQLLKQCQV